MERISVGEMWTRRALHVCILVLAFSAPISIAATQAAWAFAILFWLLRLIFVRPRFRVESFDIAVLAFVGLSLISSFFSYEPRVSLGKMAAVSLVSIVYLVSQYVGSIAMTRRVVIVLLASCFIACIYSFAEQAIGKNLKVIRLASESPLRVWGIEENDTILKADGVEINSPTDLIASISRNSDDGVVEIIVYRHELVNRYNLYTGFLSPDLENVDYLGIVEWSRGRDTRAAGFYGHYTTFAEALQLSGSLALGLFITMRGGFLTRNRVLLGIALAAYIAALFLSLTRASWVSFTVSAAVMVLIGARRRTMLICAALAAPLVISGVLYLQAKRQVGFIDTADYSTSWRIMVWREGSGVLTSSPRHLLVGVGMDSLKTHWQDWHMFDDGRQPVGHLHSTPLQLAFERGVPTLIAWIVWMALYLRMLWQGFRRSDGWTRGLFLGAFGGAIGFLASGIVHYNWGDSEVVMIFYLIMGLSLAIIRNIEPPQEAAVSSLAQC